MRYCAVCSQEFFSSESGIWVALDSLGCVLNVGTTPPFWVLPFALLWEVSQTQHVDSCNLRRPGLQCGNATCLSEERVSGSAWTEITATFGSVAQEEAQPRMKARPPDLSDHSR